VIPIDRAHSTFVHRRRAVVLERLLAGLFPPSATSVLDVGCGDGLVAAGVAAVRPGMVLRGIDVLKRPRTHIPVELFDGRRIPHGDKSFDVVMMVDVLHHSENPEQLLGEAGRVARQCLIVKDHLSDAWLATPRLRLMDYVGNARHGVSLPCVYWRHEQWMEAFSRLGLMVERWETDLGLYPWFADWVFGSSLHFAARLGRVNR
jgi:SAM-dependent methyltransferase